MAAIPPSTRIASFGLATILTSIRLGVHSSGFQSAGESGLGQTLWSSQLAASENGGALGSGSLRITAHVPVCSRGSETVYHNVEFAVNVPHCGPFWGWGVPWAFTPKLRVPKLSVREGALQRYYRFVHPTGGRGALWLIESSLNMLVRPTQS